MFEDMRTLDIVLIVMALLGVAGIAYLIWRMWHPSKGSRDSYADHPMSMEDVPYEEDYEDDDDERDVSFEAGMDDFEEDEAGYEAGYEETYADSQEGANLAEYKRDAGFEGFADLADNAAPYEPFTIMETAALTDDSNAAFPDTGLM